MGIVKAPEGDGLTRLQPQKSVTFPVVLCLCTRTAARRAVPGSCRHILLDQSTVLCIHKGGVNHERYKANTLARLGA